MKNIIRKANLSSGLRLMFVLLTVLVTIGTAEAATYTVTTTNESGSGSLRDAIVQANANPGADTIEFAAGATGTITLASLLPAITGDITISGPGAGVLTVSGNSSFRIFDIASGVTVSISGLTISNANAVTGGAISNDGMLTITSSTLSDNSASSSGGAIATGLDTEATLTIMSSTLSGNTALSGGAIWINKGTVAVINSTLSGNHATGTFLAGGGILQSTGTLTITSSTISGNSAGGGGGVASFGFATVTNSTFSGNSAAFVGGGILNGGGINIGMLTVTNCTISGNSASLGGGIRHVSGTLTITSSTLSGNSASLGGGIDNLAPATFKNSIIASSPAGGNFAGTVAITAAGVNFSTDDTCGAGFMQVTPGELNLGPLQDNGGPTLTHALLEGSVAIDAVTDCTDLSDPPVPVATDQRGVNRPLDGDGDGSAWCDAGAFEAPCFAGPPEIDSCPANITQDTDPGQCSAVVTYTTPTATGCPMPTVTCNPPSGSTFPKGTTTVTCTANNGTPNPPNDTCSFTVTVNDTTTPSISCPANISRGTDPGLCSAVITYTTPTATDNCPDATVSCVPASGSIFPKGVTTVTCTATDGSGNTASCSFTVTVTDTQPPSITCPANIVGVATSPAGAVVNYSLPTVADSCPGVGPPGCNPPSGSTFAIGVTTVNCTVSDAAGNSNACSFTVTVLTLAQEIQSLIDRVQVLVTAGVLNPPQGNGLIAKLRDALDGLNRGNTRVACNKLADFIKQANALIGSGVLTPAQGDPLVQSATNIRNVLGCS